jgi:hypothetical protein
MLVSVAMDLLLCAIDAKTGQAWFGPKLSYALPVAELAHLVQASRIGLRDGVLVIVDPEPTGEPLADTGLTDLRELPPTYPPLTVQQWASWRGPRRIDAYLTAAADAGIVRIVTDGQSGRKTLTVTDPEPVGRAAQRLVAVLDDPAPGFEDAAFAVLADAAGIARPRLRGWVQRSRRARLTALGHSTPDGDNAQVLRTGCKAITELSRLATADPRSIDQQIGLTPAARRAARVFR